MKALTASTMPRPAHGSLAAALSVALALTVASGCRKHDNEQRSTPTLSAAEVAQRAAAARTALHELRPRLDALGATMASLHREFDPLPPGLPGFGPTRSKFYATAEGVGMLGAKLPWLAARIDTAEKSRDAAALSALSRDVERVDDQLRNASLLAIELRREVQPFKSVAEQPFGPPPIKCE